MDYDPVDTDRLPTLSARQGSRTNDKSFLRRASHVHFPRSPKEEPNAVITSYARMRIVAVVSKRHVRNAPVVAHHRTILLSTKRERVAEVEKKSRVKENLGLTGTINRIAPRRGSRLRPPITLHHTCLRAP